MMPLFLIIYGAWMVGVGYHGNGSQAGTFIGQQKGFVPWIIAVVILYALSQSDAARPAVKPLATIIIVALVLTRWQTMKADVTGTWHALGLGTSTGSAPAVAQVQQ